jgi:hypothetical protein
MFATIYSRNALKIRNLWISSVAANVRIGISLYGEALGSKKISGAFLCPYTKYLYQAHRKNVFFHSPFNTHYSEKSNSLVKGGIGNAE